MTVSLAVSVLSVVCSKIKDIKDEECYSVVLFLTTRKFDEYEEF